jgi:Uma2 family endonuclease
MSTTALIPVEQYLATSYRPDCDYVDGEVQERNFGEFEHATLQGEVLGWFRQHAKQWKIRVLPEQRINISSSRYRVPDVTVLRADQPVEKIFTAPPLLVVEIQSPKDTLKRIRECVNEYVAFGIQNIWLIDPYEREAFRCTANGFDKASELTIPNTPIFLPLAEIFKALDA